jgi:hypothetical protein
VWRLEQKAGDFVVARNGLHQAIVGGAIEIESAVFHQSNI